MERTILSLDPSSTATGWALLDLAGRIVQGGIIKSDKLRNEPQFRIKSMAEEFRQLLNEFGPGIVIIEITSGKVGLNRHKGSGSGLSIYGMAVGYLWAVTDCWLRQLPAEQQGQTQIVPIRENLWCRGISKADRIAAVACEFPEYNPADDPGGDLADAVSLGQWYLKEHRARLVEAVV
jgi:hypothetical protein